MMESLTPATILLFFAYTLITLLAALVARIGVSNMGKKAEAGAIEAVTAAFSGTLNDAREASNEARQARTELSNEREKRANLEGKVESLMNQVTQEKSRADAASMEQTRHITLIGSMGKEVGELRNELKAIRDRLTVVESEKKTLEAEKHKLENDLSTQGEDYRKLMSTIQERIDKAVADVRDTLRLEYEGHITNLELQIRERDEEIVKLTALLKENESHENLATPSAALDPAAPAPLAPDTGTGSDGSPTLPSADTGNSDGQSSGGSPSA